MFLTLTHRRATQSLLVLAIAALAATLPAQAAVNFTTSQAGFLSGSNATLQADFESFSSSGDVFLANPTTIGSVTFSHPSNLYLAVPGGAAAVADFDVQPTSNVLTASGNEDIALTFSGPAPTAIGFTTYTNGFAAPVVDVYDTANALLGSYTLAQGPASIGFIGITSSIGIGRVQWTPTNGQVTDTALDNVYVGQVPEPGTWALLLAGGALVAGVARRRR